MKKTFLKTIILGAICLGSQSFDAESAQDFQKTHYELNLDYRRKISPIIEQNREILKEITAIEQETSKINAQSENSEFMYKALLSDLYAHGINRLSIENLNVLINTINYANHTQSQYPNLVNMFIMLDRCIGSLILKENIDRDIYKTYDVGAANSIFGLINNSRHILYNVNLLHQICHNISYLLKNNKNNNDLIVELNCLRNSLINAHIFFSENTSCINIGEEQKQINIEAFKNDSNELNKKLAALKNPK